MKISSTKRKTFIKRKNVYQAQKEGGPLLSVIIIEDRRRRRRKGSSSSSNLGP